MNHVKIVLMLLVFSLGLSSCSTYQASMKKHDKLEYESIRAYPEWTYKEPKGKWILPVIGLSAGAAYGYKTQFTYEDEVYTGKKNAAIWAGVGLIGGALINGLIFKKRNYQSYKYDPSQSKKWVDSYNKVHRTNYMLYRTEPNNSMILIPRNRVADLEKYEQAKRNKKIAQVEAEEDRIRIQKENRRLQQQKELSNEEKRRNIVNHLRWEPITITGEKEVYPSALITATTYAGTQNTRNESSKSISNYIGLYLDPEVTGATISYEIESTDGKMLAKSSGTINVNRGGNVFPEINWRSDDLLKNKFTRPLKVTFRIKDEAGNYAEKVMDLAVMSINECILSMNGEDLYWNLPAYVNEQNPLIEGILKEALDKGYIDAWTGYQRGEKGVFDQVEAIWKVLSDRRFRYSSITGAGNVSQGKVFSQHIRTVSEAIRGEQANCIDGTLLFASILRRIEIDPYIMLYPGHANLGFDVYDKNKKSKYYLEITALPDASFDQAIHKGFRNYAKVPLSQKTTIDIDLSRKQGIKPLGN